MRTATAPSFLLFARRSTRAHTHTHTHTQAVEHEDATEDCQRLRRERNEAQDKLADIVEIQQQPQHQQQQQQPQEPGSPAPASASTAALEQKLSELAEQNSVLINGLHEAEKETERAKEKADQKIVCALPKTPLLNHPTHNTPSPQAALLEEQQRSSPRGVGADAELQEWSTRCSELRDKLAELQTRTAAAERSLAEEQQRAEDYAYLAKEMTQRADELELRVAAIDAQAEAAAPAAAAEPAVPARAAEEAEAALKAEVDALKRTVGEFKSKNIFLAVDQKQLVVKFQDAEAKCAQLKRHVETLQQQFAEEKQQKDTEIEGYQRQIQHLSVGAGTPRRADGASASPVDSPVFLHHEAAEEQERHRVAEGFNGIIDELRTELTHTQDELQEQLRINASLRCQIEEMREERQRLGIADEPLGRVSARQLSQAQAAAAAAAAATAPQQQHRQNRHRHPQPHDSYAEENTEYNEIASRVAGQQQPPTLQQQQRGRRSSWRDTGDASTHQAPHAHHDDAADAEGDEFLRLQIANLDELTRVLGRKARGVAQEARLLGQLNIQSDALKVKLDTAGQRQANDARRQPASAAGAAENAVAHANTTLVELLRDTFEQDASLLSHKNVELKASVDSLRQTYAKIIQMLGNQDGAGADAGGGGAVGGDSAGSRTTESDVENIALRCVVRLVAEQVRTRDEKIQRLRDRYVKLRTESPSARTRGAHTNAALQPGGVNVADVVADLSEAFAKVQRLAELLDATPVPTAAAQQLESVEEFCAGLLLKYSSGKQGFVSSSATYRQAKKHAQQQHQQQQQQQHPSLRAEKGAAAPAAVEPPRLADSSGTMLAMARGLSARHASQRRHPSAGDKDAATAGAPVIKARGQRTPALAGLLPSRAM